MRFNAVLDLSQSSEHPAGLSPHWELLHNRMSAKEISSSLSVATLSLITLCLLTELKEAGSTASLLSGNYSLCFLAHPLHLLTDELNALFPFLSPISSFLSHHMATLSCCWIVGEAMGAAGLLMKYNCHLLEVEGLHSEERHSPPQGCSWLQQLFLSCAERLKRKFSAFSKGIIVLITSKTFLASHSVTIYLQELTAQRRVAKRNSLQI